MVHDGDKPDDTARLILRRWPVRASSVEPLGSGLINRTFLVRVHGRRDCILQQVNPVFPAGIHDDIEAVTVHLAARGMPTPRLIRSREGALCVEEAGGVWRLMDRIQGESRERLQRPSEAEAAGSLLARFHGALLDLRHDFHHARAGVHDTPRHLQRLRDAVEKRSSHPCFGTVLPLAEEILQAAQDLPRLSPLPERAVHGDPKISNMVFRTGTDEAICLVDLDTLGKMPLPLEIGDALRSWCNPAGEDSRDGSFSAEMFRAAITGYGGPAAHWITSGEVEAILPATLTICVELAARFCTDALNEDYFGWDPQRFGSHSEHSEVRAAGQLAMARSLVVQMKGLEPLLEEAFA